MTFSVVKSARPNPTLNLRNLNQNHVITHGPFIVLESNPVDDSEVGKFEPR